MYGIEREVLKEIDFIDYYSKICSYEVEYFVVEAKYTTFFNNSILKLINGLKKQGKKDIELIINFNDQKEIVSLDAEIIGDFIGDLFLAKFCSSCSKTEINELVQNVKLGDYETQKEFSNKIFVITYSNLREIYEKIIFKKEVFQNICKELNIKNYNECDRAIYVLSIAILNNIMNYLRIKKDEKDKIINIFQSRHNFLSTV